LVSVKLVSASSGELEQTVGADRRFDPAALGFGALIAQMIDNLRPRRPRVEEHGAVHLSRQADP
jgi:hypothetical protein